MGNKHSEESKFDSDARFVVGSINSGLGNQLFQIATAYAYAKRYNLKLYLNRDWKGKSASRPSYWHNLLSHPKIQECLVSNPPQTKKIHTEPFFSYTRIPNYYQNITLKGYFQSEQYFLDYASEIKEIFKLPEELDTLTKQRYQELIDNRTGPFVAVHIRRGDYVNSNKHTVLPASYYEEAKSRLEKELNLTEPPTYIYFTDDPMWVKLNCHFTEKDILFSGKQLKDYEEFALMRQCEHYIIANSSFSWWASWLSDGPKNYGSEISKIVIAPYQWFLKDKFSVWKDIYSQSQGWIMIGQPPIKSFERNFFMGVITCEKYKKRVEEQNLSQYNFKFPYRYFIGNPELTEAVENKEEKIVYLPCKDNYESLPQKVYAMLKWITTNYPEVECICKLDDDVKISFRGFMIYSRLAFSHKFDYAGFKVKSKGQKGKCHLGRTEDEELGKTVIDIPDCQYCAGPAYYLSRKSANIILEDLWKPESKTTIYEDQSIGHCLGLRGIYPYHLTHKNNAFFWK